MIGEFPWRNILHRFYDARISMIKYISRSSRDLKSILQMLGLEPETSRLGMLSECAYDLRYIPIHPSAHTHCTIAGRQTYSARCLQIYNIKDIVLKIIVNVKFLNSGGSSTSPFWFFATSGIYNIINKIMAKSNLFS